MELAKDLVSQFAKLNSGDKPESKKESIVSGKAIVSGGVTYVQLDGSDLWTPVNTTATIKAEGDPTVKENANGERVTVLIKDHTATIIGNTSTPAARSDDVEENGKKIDEFDIVEAHKVTVDDIQALSIIANNIRAITASYNELSAVTAELETLIADIAEIKYVKAEDVSATMGKFENLKTTIAEVGILDADDLSAVNAEIDNLITYSGTFTYAKVELLKAYNADIGTLHATKLDADFANIDSANIDKAVFGEFYAQSGIIEDYTVKDGVVTGRLVAVSINADNINAGSLKAERIMLQGNDGLFYKLNVDAMGQTTAEQLPADEQEKLKEGIHGKSIIAKSITADKIQVSDLVAFGATIGGFTIGYDRIYSMFKETVDDPNSGVYLDNEGQFTVGDQFSYLTFRKVVKVDENGDPEYDESGDPVYEVDESGNPIYRLSISADSIVFGNSGRNADDLAKLADRVKMGSYEGKPGIELSEDNDKALLTNETLVFTEDSTEGLVEKTKVGRESVKTDTLIINKETRTVSSGGSFVWATRANGNYGLSWRGETS